MSNLFISDKYLNALIHVWSGHIMVKEIYHNMISCALFFENTSKYGVKTTNISFKYPNTSTGKLDGYEKVFDHLSNIVDIHDIINEEYHDFVKMLVKAKESLSDSKGSLTWVTDYTKSELELTVTLKIKTEEVYICSGNFRSHLINISRHIHREL